MCLKSYLLSKQFSRILLVKAYRRYLKLKRYIVLATTKSDFSGKIFCIGYQKTGTTTLGRSLEMLGYHHSSYDNEIYTKYYKHKLNLPKILEYTSKFESFDDQPWFKVDLIPVLDRKFPNSKFIYLTRDEESWKNSMHNWGKKKWGEYPNVDEGLEGFIKHRQFVMEYFKGRLGKDFLILDIKDPMGFKKLSDFLGKSAPMDSFPHFNKTEKVVSKF